MRIVRKNAVDFSATANCQKLSFATSSTLFSMAGGMDTLPSKAFISLKPDPVRRTTARASSPTSFFSLSLSFLKAAQAQAAAGSARTPAFDVRSI